MMRFEFKRGEAYFATPCMREMPRRFVVCIGRTSDRGVAFAFADDLAVGKLILAGKMDGREFCQLDASNGHRYNVSAAVPVPAEVSAEVLAMIRFVNESYWKSTPKEEYKIVPEVFYAE